MQSTLDAIKTRTKRIYLGHPLMWKLGSIYESMTRLGVARRIKSEEECQDDPLLKMLRDTREEERIAGKYDFAKKTFLGYKMTRDFPLDFPDSEFEERYAARNLHF